MLVSFIVTEVWSITITIVTWYWKTSLSPSANSLSASSTVCPGLTQWHLSQCTTPYQLLDHQPWTTTLLLPASSPTLLQGRYMHVHVHNYTHTLPFYYVISPTGIILWVYRSSSMPALNLFIVNFLSSILACSSSSFSSSSSSSSFWATVCSTVWLHCYWGCWGLLCRRWGSGWHDDQCIVVHYYNYYIVSDV